MARIETWFEQDLQELVAVRMLTGNLFSLDNQGNLIGVKVFDGGTPATLSGTVSGNVILPNGGTVAVTGTLSGNQAYIILPQAAYVPGVITIAIKLTSSGVITTLAAVSAVVYRTSTDTTVDPGTIIPSIQTLINQINTAVASIPADYSSLWTTLAPAFSTSTAYTAGQYVTYSGAMYRFTKPHAAGSWASGDVAAVNIGAELTDLKSALKDNTYKADSAIIDIGRKTTRQFPVQLNVEIGTYDTAGYADAPNRARSQVLPAGSYHVKVTSNYQFAIVKYVSDSAGTVYVSGRTDQSFTLTDPFVIQLRHVSSGESFKNAELSTINQQIEVTIYKDEHEYFDNFFEEGNLYDIHLCQIGIGIDANGAETTANNNVLTDYIYVGDITTLYTRNSNKTVVYYDKSKTYLSQVTSNASSYTLPSGCEYVRVSAALPNTANLYISKKSTHGSNIGIKARNGLTGVYVEPDIADMMNKSNIDKTEKMNLGTVAFNGHAGYKSYQYTLGEPFSIYAKNTAAGNMDIRITGNSINAIGVVGLNLYVYIPDATKVTTIACALTGTSNSRSFTSFTNGWNILRYNTYQGSLATWETIQGMRITTAGSAGIEFYVAKIEIIRPEKATMILINDGGYKTFIDYAYDTLKGYGIPVTWALNPGRMGDDLGARGRLMTEAEALAMSSDYCSEFSFHCWSATERPTQYMTAIELQNDCQRCVDYLRKKGLAPEHIWRAAHAQNNAPYYMAEVGIVEALATGTENGASLCIFPFENRWNVPRYSIHSRTDAQFDTIFDTLKKTHCGIVPYTHGVYDGDDHDINEASMDYFISKVVTGITEGWLNPTTYNYWTNAQLK